MDVTSIGSNSFPFALRPGDATAQAEQVPFNLEDLLSFKIDKDDLEDRTQDFQSKVRQLLAEKGINLDQPLQFGNDAFGYVRVQGDVPHKDEIEQLFVDHRELQQDYAKISSATSLLRAASGYTNYADEYARLSGNFAAQKALVDSEVARNNAPVFITVNPFDNEISTLV